LDLFAVLDELVLAAIPAKLPTIRTVMALERSSVFMGISSNSSIDFYTLAARWFASAGGV
jgi:hypothetical protein